MTGSGISTKRSETITMVWEEENQKLGGIYNPTDGKLIRNKFSTCLKNTAIRICHAESVDAIVFPEIVGRVATLDRTSLYWDGTTQDIEKEKGSVDPFSERFSGNTNALSLRVFIVDKNGYLVLRSMAGIEHPYIIVGEGNEKRWKVRQDLLTDTARISRAVAVSLHPFIFYPEYPAKPIFSEE
jgi:hypothetical protein